MATLKSVDNLYPIQSIKCHIVNHVLIVLCIWQHIHVILWQVISRIGLGVLVVPSLLVASWLSDYIFFLERAHGGGWRWQHQGYWGIVSDFFLWMVLQTCFVNSLVTLILPNHWQAATGHFTGHCAVGWADRHFYNVLTRFSWWKIGLSYSDSLDLEIRCLFEYFSEFV